MSFQTKDFENFFKLSVNMLCIAGTDGYFRKLNPAFSKTLGWTDEELMAKPFLEFIHPDDIQSTLDEIEKLSKGATTIKFENRYLCKNGSYKWLSWSAEPTPDGTLYAAAVDITSEKENKIQLQENEKRMRYLYEISALSAVEIDKKLPQILKSVAMLLKQDIGIISKIQDSNYEIYEAYHPENALSKNQIFNLGNTYCDILIKNNKRSLAISHMKESKFHNHPCYNSFKLESYIGSIIKVNGAVYGTLNFSSSNPYQKKFNKNDTRLVQIMAQWIGNIFERKEKNEQLIRSEFLLNEAQKIGNIGGWEINLKTKELYWSDEVYRIHEVPIGTKVVLEEGINFYHPDHRPIIEAAVKESIENGTEYDLELKLITAKGNKKWVRAKGSVVKKNGEVVGARGVFQDIDEQVRAKEELELNKERLDLAIKGSNDGVWDWYDTSADEEWWSDKFYELLGYKRGEIDSKFSIFKDFLLHPEDISATLEAISSCQGENSAFDVEHRLKHKNKGYRWYRCRANVVKDKNGNITRMTGSISDIDQQKLSQKQLADSEEKFRFLYEESPLGLALCEMDGSFIDVNKAYLDIIGYSSLDEIKKLSYWDITPKEYEEVEIEQLKSINTLGKYGPFEKEYFRKDGKRIPVLLNGVVVNYSDGKKRLWSTVEDITLRKESENKLREYTEELKQFTYVATHDIKSPITNIESYLRFLKQDSDIKSERSLQSLKWIERSIEHSKKKILELVTVAQARDTIVKLEAIDLKAKINNTLDSLSSTIEKNKIKIIKTISLSSEIISSKKHVNAILQNLISNAIKYRSEQETPIVKIEIKQNGNMIYIGISDNGIGISGHNKTKVFELFKRANTSHEGSGIGLYIVKKAVEKLEGTIEVESEEGKGSTFKVFLKNNLAIEKIESPKKEKNKKLTF